jgi:hypothetical protein
MRQNIGGYSILHFDLYQFQDVANMGGQSFALLLILYFVRSSILESQSREQEASKYQWIHPMSSGDVAVKVGVVPVIITIETYLAMKSYRL